MTRPMRGSPAPEPFFVSGFNKSGTTFLQMLLDAHPTIRCPSEHCFAMLRRGLAQISEQYAAQLRSFDERTARQGIAFDAAHFERESLRAMLRALLEADLPAQITHSGLNDNGIADDVTFWAALMPEAKFCLIVRDPRELAISLWHHKRRTEPRFAQADVPLQQTARAVAAAWPAHARGLLAARGREPARVCIVRYEDLRGEARSGALQTLLQHLGAESSPEQLEPMLAATEFEALRSREATARGGQPGFYRSGRCRSWCEQLDAESCAAFEAQGAAELAAFGYR